MTTPQTHTIEDRASAICRQIFALTRQGEEWDVADLEWLRTMQAHLTSCVDRAVRACRDNGANDAEIAFQLGVTRQAVSKRWPGGGRYVGAAGRYRSTRSDADDAA